MDTECLTETFYFQFLTRDFPFGMYVFKMSFSQINRLMKSCICFFIEFAALRDADSVWTSQTLDFVPPNRFDPEKYRDGIVQVPDDVWEAVPSVVASTLATVMGPDVPIDPMIAFRYFKNGHLPEYVVYYFNWMQKATGTAKRLSKTTIFCRSMHYIEAFREYMLNQFQVHEFGGQDEEMKKEPDDDTGAVPDKEEDPGIAADPAVIAAYPEPEADSEPEADPEPDDDTGAKP